MKNKNLSNFEFELPERDDFTIGVIAATWNSQVTDALLDGALSLLKEQGIEDIIVKRVPGAYELTIAADLMISYTDVDAVIVLGAIVRGETPHFDFIAQGVTQGINSVSVKYSTPVIFGVLTTDTMEQALERAGGKHGNKGAEAAATALYMANQSIEYIESEGDDFDIEELFNDENILDFIDFEEEEEVKPKKKSTKRLN